MPLINQFFVHLFRSRDSQFDVVGRSLAIHANHDDFGLGPTNASKINGNAGNVIACGKIELEIKKEKPNSANTFLTVFHFPSIFVLIYHLLL